MPRIRSIKPEHWDDKNLPKISLGAHLLWISMWNFSDDKGIIENDCHLIKSNSFPRRREIKPSNIKKWVDELIKYNFVISFKYNGTQYLIHRTFDAHQKIDKPQKSKIDEETIRGVFAEHSSKGSGTIDDDSDSIRRKDRIGEEGIGLGKEADDDFKKKFLVPEMQKIWKVHKPEYPAIVSKDSPALQSIAVFICEQAGINYHARKNGDDKNLYELWGTIAKFVSAHDFYKKYNLQQVEKYIQTITQEIKNGQSGYQNGKPGNGKVNGEQLNTAFATFYSQSKQT